LDIDKLSNSNAKTQNDGHALLLRLLDPRIWPEVCVKFD